MGHVDEVNFGLDGLGPSLFVVVIVSSENCCRTVFQIGGVLLPCFWICCGAVSVPSALAFKMSTGLSIVKAWKEFCRVSSVTSIIFFFGCS